MSKIVIALGGNALGNTPAEQLELSKKTAGPIVDLIEEGHQVVIVHGNGPQVGMINLAFNNTPKASSISDMPFPECGSMSQGYMGYHLQTALKSELMHRSIDKSVVTIVTQVVVDINDEAFNNPTKPIGGFYTKEEAMELEKEKGFSVMEDSGRGYRRVVPSPKPVDIVEKDAIRVVAESGNIVIAVGGGGIPVVHKGNEYVGVSAVIDKDFASQKLAEMLDADYLIILTAVEKVAINYGKENQEFLTQASVSDMLKYMEEGHFAPGSMLPKVEAAILFAKSRTGRKALITSLEKAKEGVQGKTGTIIMDASFHDIK